MANDTNVWLNGMRPDQADAYVGIADQILIERGLTVKLLGDLLSYHVFALFGGMKE
jgi:hypothetical protein